jgi:hypothetical protein
MMSGTSIEFDFRFDPNVSLHEQRRAVRAQLIEQFAVEHGGTRFQRVEIYPVSRAGKSGSEVFYLDLFRKGVSYPARFVAKFQTIERTEREGASALDAQHAGLCTTIFTYKHATEDIGVIVYGLANSPDHIEFRGYFLDLTHCAEDCASALNSIFKLVGLHPNQDRPCKLLLDDFDWYVNRKSEPLQKIDSFVDPVGEAEASPLSKIATEIKSHYERIKADINVEVFPYLVHGDLHARNLMLSKSTPSRSELIDFDWVHYGHPAKDFVLMEATLKYMLLPEILPTARGNSKEALHISVEAFDALERFVAVNGFDLPSVAEMELTVFGNRRIPQHQRDAMSRMYTCMVEVRRSAGIVLRKYCMSHSGGLTAEQHYFAALFLVTLGLFGLSELEPIWTLIGLRSTGERLWQN